MQVSEIIRSVDNRQRTFECELVSVDNEKAIVHHIRKQDYDIGLLVIPSGGVTQGIYWQDRNFNVWKMLAPAGKLIGYYINICEDVKISKDKIVWTDLVLDLWIDNLGSIHWLDEDEVKEYKSNHLLSDSQMGTIEKTKQYLERNYQNIISEVNKCFDGTKGKME